MGATMTPEEFSARYRLRVPLANGSVESWSATRIARGDDVMVHRLMGAQRSAVQHMVNQLGEPARTLILAQEFVENVPVVVTETIPQFSTFVAWLQSNVISTSSAVLRPLRRDTTPEISLDGPEPSVASPLTSDTRDTLRFAMPGADDSPVFRLDTDEESHVSRPAHIDSSDELTPPDFNESFGIIDDVDVRPDVRSSHVLPPPTLTATESEFTQVIRPRMDAGLSVDPALVPQADDKRPPSKLPILIVVGVFTLAVAVLALVLLQPKR